LLDKDKGKMFEFIYWWQKSFN